jgi:multiple antibiotic resistance protein
MEYFTPLLKTLVSLLVIVNPVSAVPMFLGLTQGQTDAQRNQLARLTGMATFLILLVAALFGKVLLNFFGISLPSFRVAGGILFLLMGIDMLNARSSRSRETPEEREEAENRKDIAIVPMAIPQLAGPGAIGSVILFMDSGPFWKQLPQMAGIVVAISLLSWLSLRMATPLGSLLGKTGIYIFARVEGLLLVALAVEFILNGIRQLWFVTGH